MTATASALHLPPRQQSRFWRRFRRHRLAVVGTGFMLILICLALFAPFLATHDPYQLDMRATKEPPNAEYLLGTDTAGRDMWSRLIYAGRISLSVGIVSVTIYITIGTILGAELIAAAEDDHPGPLGSPAISPSSTCRRPASTSRST